MTRRRLFLDRAGAGPIAALCALLLVGCASERTPGQVEGLLTQAFRAAETHHEFDLDPEAFVLLDAIAAIDQRFPELHELKRDLAPEASRGVERTLLGMNRKLRPELERSPAMRALLYLPDRLLDLMDVLTFGVHLGPGAYADVHATRAVQVSGGFRATGGLGIHDHRSIGMKSQSEAGLTVVALGAHSYGGALVGTSGVVSSADSSAGLHRPTSRLYQDLRDYWAVGGSASAVFLGVEADFHPCQLADFFAGFVGVDFLNDDLAHTRGLRLDAIEAKLVRELREIARSEETVAAYHDAQLQGRLRSGTPRLPEGEPDPDATAPARAPTGWEGGGLRPRRPAPDDPSF